MQKNLFCHIAMVGRSLVSLRTLLKSSNVNASRNIRLITTKQTKYTVVAEKSLENDVKFDTKSDVNENKSVVRFSNDTKRESPGDDQSVNASLVYNDTSLVSNERKRWQNPTTKLSIVVEEPVYHTCETFEEHEHRLKTTFFKYRPECEFSSHLPTYEKRGIMQLLTTSKGLSVENIQLMRTLLGLESVGNNYRDLKKELKWAGKVEDQKFRQERYDILGPDLAAAHFFVFRDAKVRFHGHNRWLCRNEDDKYDLPKKYVEGIKIKEIDASNMDLVYEGLENFDGCDEIESINLANTPNTDNFFIDYICKEHGHSLTSLDISYCPRITIGGITALGRLKNLKHLTITGLEINHLLLASMNLEDSLQGLKIYGLPSVVPIIDNLISEKETKMINSYLQDTQKLSDQRKAMPLE